jgi:hypothetical protein
MGGGGGSSSSNDGGEHFLHNNAFVCHYDGSAIKLETREQ